MVVEIWLQGYTFCKMDEKELLHELPSLLTPSELLTKRTPHSKSSLKISVFGFQGLG